MKQGLFTIVVILAAALQAHAQTLLPGSTSPDGKSALVYRMTPSQGYADACEFHFCDPKTLNATSEQLVPDVTGKVLGADPAVDYDADTGLLLELITHQAEAIRLRKLADPAFDRSVVWSADSNWVAIEGGAHKFWHLVVYHRVRSEGAGGTKGGDAFQRVELPRDAAFVKYCRTHRADLQEKKLVTLPALKREGINGRRPLREEMWVQWLKNGLLAVEAHPYVLREDDLEKSFYFVLDCSANPKAMIAGFRGKASTPDDKKP